ncbi:MAG: hypothetical protein BWZ10_03222 [candidate division BRC1 bacterium ADurb.BinA364]|nr:MAG: hypothetical protein BWZ10_03222 [candidate division BRC1 bacterium ADurb.BinA364]
MIKFSAKSYRAHCVFSASSPVPRPLAWMPYWPRVTILPRKTKSAMVACLPLRERKVLPRPECNAVLLAMTISSIGRLGVSRRKSRPSPPQRVGLISAMRLLRIASRLNVSLRWVSSSARMETPELQWRTMLLTNVTSSIQLHGALPPWLRGVSTTA